MSSPVGGSPSRMHEMTRARPVPPSPAVFYIGSGEIQKLDIFLIDYVRLGFRKNARERVNISSLLRAGGSSL